MPLFNVHVTYQARATFYGVEANSMAEAIEMAENGEGKCSKLPSDPEYVDDTFKIDTDAMRNEYGKDWKNHPGEDF